MKGIAIASAGGIFALTAILIAGGARAPEAVQARLAPQASAAPVVVELFTSQGCSSCPPADALLGKLSREPGVVAITRPVTYWDRLGWKDTLAKPANTDLQRAYNTRKLPGGGAFTPEAVVAGRFGAVGGDEKRIRRLIAEAQAGQQLSITIAGNEIMIAGGKGRAQVELVKLRPSVAVKIGSGENGGRSVNYVHVLVSEQTLGTWTGASARFALPGDARSAGLAAILLRAGKAGPILAARLL